MCALQSVRVRVERYTNKPSVPRCNLFEKEIQIPDGLCVPYDSLYSTFQFLYGSECVVTFELSRI